ncbi:CstA-like transporter-associated (seleno)protein [Streptomyces sp. NPDC056224]|uniref:CstA-like transporter-associated (seleno)protein n=1 Tax=Streptomyces sp. NPDC056224 TaxID=3345750 RepID=UPI0035E23FF1
MSGRTSLRAALARARFYVREFTGEAAYDRYVAHARSHDPDARVPTRREFERARTDAREADPHEGFRCC